jgi:predicted transcriptional regulator
MSESSVVVRVDDALKSAFVDAAKAADRTASQLLRDFMRDYVRDQKKAAQYDAWFRRKVEAGIRDIEAGRVHSSEEVEEYFAKRRAASLRRVRETRR